MDAGNFSSCTMSAPTTACPMKEAHKSIEISYALNLFTTGLRRNEENLIVFFKALLNTSVIVYNKKQ